MNIDKFDELVACFSKLPGVGKKSALRYAYFVTIEDSSAGLNIANSIQTAINFIKTCSICGCLCEDEICEYCADDLRNKEILCVVENAKDVLQIEQSKSYNGLYFVFDDTDDSKIQALKKMIKINNTREIIFAMTPGISSDALILFIEDKLGEFDIKFTKIAQGIPTGVSLENIDTLSLTKAIEDRTKV